MVSVDMGAITESLFESELFGHVKGSFTNAHADRIGRFEAADGGTLFLDEIANLPYHLQAKLLTAIQKRCFIKVGSNTPQATNIRLICATNRNFEEMVRRGEFREACSTASLPSICISLPCASVKKTSCRWQTASSNNTAHSTAERWKSFQLKPNTV